MALPQKKRTAKHKEHAAPRTLDEVSTRDLVRSIGKDLTEEAERLRKQSEKKK